MWDWCENISWQIQVSSDISRVVGWCFAIHHVMRAALSLGQEFPKLCTSQSEAAKFPR